MTAGIPESIVVAATAAMAAHRLKFLTVPAALAAAILGATILLLGGWDWGAATAGSFVITAWLSQRQESREKIHSGSDRTQRNLIQVLANGLLLALFANAYRFCGGGYVWVAVFLGSLGAVAGDTWATSSTQFSSVRPRLITSGKRVPAVTPGAVTIVGVALSALAGLVASILYLSVAMIVSGDAASSPVTVTLIIAATLGAVMGSLFDSYLGAGWQAVFTGANSRLTDDRIGENGLPNIYVRGWRWLSNDLVNFSNAVAGALAAYLVWLAAMGLIVT